MGEDLKEPAAEQEPDIMDDHVALAAVERLIERYLDIKLALFPVNAKYSGPEVRSFFLMPKHIETRECTSSNVKAYGYDLRSKTLHVTFNGDAHYRYLAVEQSEYAELETSASKGKSMTMIKIRHNYLKMPNAG